MIVASTPVLLVLKTGKNSPGFSPPLLGPRDFEPRVLGCPPSASPARTTNSPESKDLAVEKVVLMHWDITWILTGIGI